MKRWKKQTRVNGVVVETLRLRNFQSADRGVMISLQLIHERKTLKLSIEVDGDTLITNRDEEEIFQEAQRLLADVSTLLVILKPLEPMPPPSIHTSRQE